MRPAISSRKSRSMVMTCGTFAAEPSGRPVALAAAKTPPGASRSRGLAVNMTAMADQQDVRPNGQPPVHV
jgi:hypothetical protein